MCCNHERKLTDPEWADLDEKLRALWVERMEEQMRQPTVRAWFIGQMGKPVEEMVFDMPTKVEAPVAKELVLA